MLTHENANLWNMDMWIYIYVYMDVWYIRQSDRIYMIYNIIYIIYIHHIYAHKKQLILD